MNKNFLQVADQQMDIARARRESDTPIASAVEALIQYLKDQESGVRDVRFECVAGPTDIVPGVKDIADKLAKLQKMQFVVNDLGSWASAAQDDPGCCQELKVIFLRLLELCDVPQDFHYGTKSDKTLPDFCTGCGANVPPIIGEGTCNKCDPFGFMDNPQLSDSSKLKALGTEMQRRGYAVYGSRHNHGPVPIEMQVFEMGCMTSVDPYRTPQPPEPTRLPEPSYVEAWPVHWPSYYNIGEPCDMRVGHCSCGAYHDVGEFTLEKDSMGRLYIKREFKKWPGDHTGSEGYSSQCDCGQCKSIRTNAAMRDRK